MNVKKLHRKIEICKALDQELSGDDKDINDFFIDLKEKIVEVNNNECPDKIYYVDKNSKDKIYLFYNKKCKFIFYSHEYIHLHFKSKFSYNFTEINNIVKVMVELHLNIKVTTIHYLYNLKY